MINSTKLEPRLQKLVDLGESGTDIMHGHLKNLMYDTEQEMSNPGIDQEILSYLNGKLDALTEIYTMTYNLAFAISDRRKQNG
jgi:hypothetical protein